jgi:hypothetical protein
LKADNYRRVQLPNAKPGEVFLFEDSGQGRITLTLVQPAAPKEPTCRLEEEGGFTVAVPDQTIDEGAIQELLADFP